MEVEGILRPPLWSSLLPAVADAEACMTDINRIIEKIERLRPLPIVIQKIIASLGDPDKPLSDIIQLIDQDPAITANLLKILNSAHFGLMGKVDSVQRAVALMGTKRVAELVLTYGFSKNLQNALAGYGLAKGELWKYSLASAMTAKKLAEGRQLGNLPAIYTAALLRDIGKVVLNEYVSQAIGEIQQQVIEEGLSFIEAERACIGADHAAIGGMIARRWHFSPNMIFMIENHHLTHPEASKDPATTVLYWADMVAMMVGTGAGADRLHYPVNGDRLEAFCLSKAELSVLMQMFKGYFRGAEHFFLEAA
jgi:HD-like signal output (HDOD) protein